MRTWELSIGHGFRCYDCMFMVSIFLWNFVDYARSCCDLFRGAVTEFCFFIFVFAVVFRIFGSCECWWCGWLLWWGLRYDAQWCGAFKRVPRVLLWYATGQALSRLAAVWEPSVYPAWR